jgi:hypothetical protein
MTQTAIFDYDVIKYNVAAACEKRSILVTHPSGIEETFDTRTEFYGHHKKKAGGWLEKYNEKAAVKLLPEEFTIEDKKELKGPIEHCLSSVKSNIMKTCEKLGVSEYRGYIGRGDSFRVERSTILKYKGQRTAGSKPLLLPDIEEYLIKYHDAEVVTHLEADDVLVMECYKKLDNILCCVDKDFDGVNHLNIYNTNQEKQYFTGAGLGSLWRVPDKKTGKPGKVAGVGRKFFYHQILAGDDSDNYCANSASDIEWGDVSSFKLLDGCKTDKECLEALVDGYKTLYPSRKKIIGWRGDEIEIDWLYVASENWDLARMLRSPTDNISFVQTLDKLAITYEQ